MAEHEVLVNEAKELVQDVRSFDGHGKRMEIIGQAQVYATLALDASIREMIELLGREVGGPKLPISITELVKQIEAGYLDNDLTAIIEAASVRENEL